MCGSLKLEHQRVTFNEKISDIGYFRGHARIDGSRDGTKSFSDQWPSSKWKIKLIPVKSFTERDKEGKIHEIKADKVAVIVSGDDVRVITRAVRNDWERNIHSRMPVTTSKYDDKGFIEFLNNKLNTKYEVKE